MATVVSATCFATPAAANPLVDAWNGIVSFFAGDARAAGEEIQSITDGSTLNGWSNHLTPGAASTENIGRIWTDKTVDDADVTLTPANITVNKGTSDFLVGLSALSSMSSITTETTRPLDIVLVLDLSGSMNDPMGAAEYSQIAGNNVSTDPAESYWIRVNGTYYKLNYYGNPGEGAYWCPGMNKYYWPQGKGNLPDWGWQSPEQVQFYEIANSKMSALQDAVNGFIDATAKVNDGITDPNLKHQISVVKFANNMSDEVGNDTYKHSDQSTVNYSQVVTNLEVYGSSNANTLKNTVNSLVAAGATRADYGMTLANKQLEDNGRANAQKAVIFFTDGEPNGGSGFDDNVANTAIQQGSEMNSEGTLVYTVGVFEGANSSQTDWTQEPAGKFNAYMNALSSKYPYAQSYKELGSPAGTHEYYRTAEDAGKLSQVFTDIAADLQTATSGSPITSASGGGEGYVTFSDELGQYMQVDDFKSIVYANTEFTKHESKTNGNTTTYTFEGDVKDPNGVFTEGDMANIVITVTKDPDNLAQGDKVTVQIPASLLPMRNYKAKVEKDGKITWQGVTPAYPIRVFYGVSLKNGVADAIKNGTADEALKTYVAAHTAPATDADGSKHEAVSFLSNKYEGGEDGTTTATFTPAKTNGYYYVDQYTPLYVDKDCEKPLTKEIWDSERPETFYYKQTVYQEGKDAAETTVQSFPVSTFAEGASGGIVVQGDGGAYGLAAGSPRLSRIRDLLDVKGQGQLGSNDTETAKNIADPNWDNKNASAKQITVNLGNNGKMFVELPGQLRVSKTVKVGENSGLDKSQFKDKEFSFTIYVEGMAGKTVKAQVVKTDGGAEVDKPFDIKFDGDGNYTHSIKDGETLVIDGLNDKAEYTVTENLAEAKGFTSSSEAESGVISSTAAATAAFTNTYVANPATYGGFTAAKKYVDESEKAMEWDGATFDFVLEAVPGTTDGNGSRDVFNNPITNVADIPMPGESKDGEKHHTVSNADPFNFGGINYTKPGKYVYRIWEESPSKDDSDWRAGVKYSNAVYIAVVVVKDNGKGGLTVDTNASTLYMRVNDDGQNTNKTDKVRTADITNTYYKDTAQTSFLATKNWTDNSGGNVGLTDGQFKFVVKAVPGVLGTDGKMTGSYDASGNPIAKSDIPKPAGENPMGNDGTSVAWGFIEFTNDMNGNHYFYDLYEEQPTKDGTYKGEPFDGAKKDEATGKWVYRGVTYDNEVYTAEVVVGVDVKDDKTQQTYTHVIYRDSKGKEVHQTDGAGTAERVPFSNSYAVNPVTGDSTLDGQKTLDGRVMKQGETFFFSLTQMAGPSDGVTGLKNKATVTGDGNKTVDVFNFGTPTFTKPGTYTFQIRETKADGENFTDADNIDGMKYDTHTATVTYVVNDTSEDNTILHTGNLRVANVTYNNENAQTAADQKATDKAPFTNFYTASATFGGIQVSKTLTGRDMKAGEFDFTITRDGDEGPEPSKSDASFGNAQDRTSGIADVMTKLSGFSLRRLMRARPTRTSLMRRSQAISRRPTFRALPMTLRIIACPFPLPTMAMEP